MEMVLAMMHRSNIGKNNIQGLGARTWRFYQGYAKFIEARAVASQSTSSTPAEVFAANVVEVGRSGVGRSASCECG